MNKLEYPALGEVLYRQVLSSGLTVLVVPRPGFSRKHAYFATDFGSLHRDFLLEGQRYHIPAGTAHFLEHKMFDLPDGRDVNGELAALGTSANAFTSYDMTAYYISGTDHFMESLSLLLEFVSTPCFSQESIEKEWGIIDQEIGMHLDSPDSQVFERLMGISYASHPIREPILGTSESIRRITPEILNACHRAFYTPGNMVLCVVGDVEPREVSALAERVLGTGKRPVGEKLRLWPEEVTPLSQKTSTRMEVAMPTFNLGFLCESVGTGETAVRRELVGDLAAEALLGESSRLYLELYNRGIIDSSFGGGFETVDGMAMLLCSGDSCNPEAIRDAVLEEAKRLSAEGVAPDDFLRMKRSAMGRRIRSLDSFDSTCYRLCACHMAQYDYFRFPELYRDITAGEIQEFLARVVLPQRCSLSVVEPLEEE